MTSMTPLQLPRWGSDSSAQTALNRRFCGKRLGPRRSVATAVGLEGCSLDEILLEMECSISPVAGLVVNHLLNVASEVVLADVIASNVADLCDVWRELPAEHQYHAVMR